MAERGTSGHVGTRCAASEICRAINRPALDGTGRSVGARQLLRLRAAKQVGIDGPMRRHAPTPHCQGPRALSYARRSRPADPTPAAPPARPGALTRRDHLRPTATPVPPTPATPKPPPRPGAPGGLPGEPQQVTGPPVPHGVEPRRATPWPPAPKDRPEAGCGTSSLRFHPKRASQRRLDHRRWRHPGCPHVRGEGQRAGEADRKLNTQRHQASMKTALRRFRVRTLPRGRGSHFHTHMASMKVGLRRFRVRTRNIHHPPGHPR